MRVMIVSVLMTMLFPAMPVGAQAGAGKKVLVAYYSHSGNTRDMARQIADATGGDLFEITPQTAYPTDYEAVVAQAKREIADGFRPALKTPLPDLSGYDVVFVGSPCWWATVAPPVATFLAGGAWTGKTVVPFMTHEGSRMGRSEKDIRELCPGATVLDGLPVRGSAVGASQEAVLKWLRGMDLAK